MASENETLADIVAEKRELAARIRASLSQVPARREDELLEAESLEREADRIEAAWKREKAEAEAAALSAGGIVEASRHKPGNAAAKRGCDWSVKNALDLANTLANHGWTGEANADAASSCIYALCGLLKDVGNAAATREALETVRKYVKETTPDKVMLGVIEVWCDEALAKPPRNCDVGTAEEQAERFAKYCDRFHRCNGCPCCGKMKYNRCEFIWAQMPYEAEEGGAK